MRVAQKRWGEVTIKKQGIGKNRFDGTKSFSVEPTEKDYTIDQLKDILETVIDLSEKLDYGALKMELDRLQNRMVVE